MHNLRLNCFFFSVNITKYKNIRKILSPPSPSLSLSLVFNLFINIYTFFSILKWNGHFFIFVICSTFFMVILLQFLCYCQHIIYKQSIFIPPPRLFFFFRLSIFQKTLCNIYFQHFFQFPFHNLAFRKI